MYQNEAAKLFQEEIREKKKAANGVHHKTGKRGYVGKMLFPTDFMKRSEKMKYRKGGKVVISNMYDEILPFDEFKKFENHEKRNRLQYWRTTYNNKEIMRGMGIGSVQFYEIVKELDLPRAPRVRKKRTGASKNEKQATAAEIVPEAAEAAVQPAVQQIIIDGLHLVFNGTYKAEKIQKQLGKIIALLNGESDDFVIELQVMQKASKDE